MKLGILGLPNVGKSTLFNAITGAGAQAANYPFCTIEPNVGIVPVPDKRLDELAKMYNPKKYTPAVIEFVDIAGLVRGAAKGEGLGNKFLSHVREVDSLIHVCRCFEEGDVVHVDGSVDPVRDIETIDIELCLADLELCERWIVNKNKAAKADRSALQDVEMLKRLCTHLEQGKNARLFETNSDHEAEFFATIPLLSAKPIIYAANISEDELISGDENPYLASVRAHAAKEGSGCIAICAKLEAECAALPLEEKEEFLKELGIEHTGLDLLITESYALLGLISYLTAGEQEVRAWTIEEGTKAPGAAGKIHTDFERGFIRAEIVAYDALMECGSMTAAKEKGLVRSEGKEYVMQDGDVTLFRFNV